MKNILLCNNLMTIGGVETALLNQVSAFTRKNEKVWVIAGKGEYSSRIDEIGGTFIECEFVEENKIDFEKVNKIVEIIRKNKISEIHIHKYQCIPTVMLAAFITKTPYFAYEHTVWDTKEYYKWKYPIYKALFPIYFNNAYKIICITPQTIQLTRNEYKIDEKKYEVVHNGIDFSEYVNDEYKANGNINNIYIVSRLIEEKKIPIIEGIDIYRQILQKNSQAKLYIIGEGDKKDDIIQYLRQNNIKYGSSDEKMNVTFLGKKTNIKDYLKKADLLLGVDRCVLEAISMKIPVIITGYNGIKGVLNSENIEIALEENFSGNNMESVSEEVCMKQLLNLSQNKDSMVTQNYNIAIEKLDCYKNYVNIPEGITIDFDWKGLFTIIEEQVGLIENQYLDIKSKYDWIKIIEKKNNDLETEKKQLIEQKEMAKKENEKIQENLRKKEEENKRISNEKEQILDELKKVYNSKRWQLMEKIDKILKRKK